MMHNGEAAICQLPTLQLFRTFTCWAVRFQKRVSDLNVHVALHVAPVSTVCGTIHGGVADAAICGNTLVV